MNFKIGNREIGDSYPCFITFEAGATHSGVEYAKKLVQLAAQAGADAVKFQIYDVDRLVSDKKQLFSYKVLVDRESGNTEEVQEPLYDILLRRSLTQNEWKEVKATADQEGLAFFATVGFPEDIELLQELKCDSIKIASADVNHHPLIRQAAKTGMCIQLDTGNSTIGEIEEAVDLVLQEGNDNLIIHQCPSGYPARLESINLNIIPTLKQMFQVPIAYSDHTPGWEMDVAAVALGANLVEKTITLDRTTRSVEHIFSLEPSDMKQFVQTIRDLETAFGSTRRLMSESERNKRLATRRSCYYVHALQKGDLITEEAIDYRRPGYGLSPKEVTKLIGNRVRQECPEGKQVEWTDLE
ncbi:N-acetylneuraminate synthase family protein [Dactylococcopsis salina]|uniref:Sialic acid synthase n=1 Tax=Dactylococcopsis salina (strain PCC 8305) TaxID=13035 RepID=K9YV67_DACS8|nr:N-acetylneuraminate synthase family protein [Dactylococcopsis salina]AFZ50816.1 sialic acid synthase [Dactylococcopsis salina PCC 8305]